MFVLFSSKTSIFWSSGVLIFLSSYFSVFLLCSFCCMLRNPDVLWFLSLIFNLCDFFPIIMDFFPMFSFLFVLRSDFYPYSYSYSLLFQVSYSFIFFSIISKLYKGLYVLWLLITYISDTFWYFIFSSYDYYFFFYFLCSFSILTLSGFI